MCHTSFSNYPAIPCVILSSVPKAFMPYMLLEFHTYIIIDITLFSFESPVIFFYRYGFVRLQSIYYGRNFTIALVGIPVAALTVQLDVLGRIINSYWQHKVDALVPTGDLSRIMKVYLCGIFTWSLTRLAPVLICLLIGPSLVDTLNAIMPVWLSNGLKIASNIFPVIGFTILLKYMPLKGNYQYLIIGFVLSAYFGASTIAVATIGLAIALFVYNLENNNTQISADSEGGNYDE